jgi:GTPase
MKYFITAETTIDNEEVECGMTISANSKKEAIKKFKEKITYLIKEETIEAQALQLTERED